MDPACTTPKLRRKLVPFSDHYGFFSSIGPPGNLGRLTMRFPTKSDVHITAFSVTLPQPADGGCSDADRRHVMPVLQVASSA
jgi:hypothetical protein